MTVPRAIARKKDEDDDGSKDEKDEDKPADFSHVFLAGS